jgi:cyclopropane fatty-acyl-phospholipid synthase-like methyltransferase
MADNKLENIKRINELWRQVYPFLASMIMDEFGRHSGRVLEIGPFSGGLSIELARLYPELDINIITWEPDEIKYMENEIADAGLADRIEVLKSGRDVFDFADGYFDLIICRGALFFLDVSLLLESFRILAKNGLAFIGGGYGRNTPQHIVDIIHDESHRLNQSLGKRWITRNNLEKLLKESGLSNYCRIEEEGGLWLTIRK